MIDISAVVIAKDEEDRIRQCIEALSFCKEIIVIDNDSSDKTFQIAESLGAKVYKIKSNNFSELRNFGKDKAEYEWILYIDADEQIDKTLAEEIKKIDSKSDFSAYTLRRKNFFLGNHEWPHIEKMQRLFNKNDLEGWFGKIHESPKFNGTLGNLEGFIIHKTHRNLESMVNKTAEWSTQEASLRLQANHPQMTWWRFPRVMLTAFFNSYLFQGGYKAGTAGLIESTYQAFSIFVTYAKLWELQNVNKNKNLQPDKL